MDEEGGPAHQHSNEMPGGSRMLRAAAREFVPGNPFVPALTMTDGLAHAAPAVDTATPKRTDGTSPTDDGEAPDDALPMEWNWPVAFWSWVAIADEPSTVTEAAAGCALDAPPLELVVCSANVKTLKPQEEKRWGQPSERRQQLEMLFHHQHASIIGLQETKSQDQVMRSGTFLHGFGWRQVRSYQRRQRHVAERWL